MAPPTGAGALPPARAFVTGGVVADPKQTGAATTVGVDVPVVYDTANPLIYGAIGLRAGADTRGGWADASLATGLNLNRVTLQMAFDAGIARLPAGQTSAGIGPQTSAYFGADERRHPQVSKHVQLMALASYWRNKQGNHLQVRCRSGQDSHSEVASTNANCERGIQQEVAIVRVSLRENNGGSFLYTAGIVKYVQAGVRADKGNVGGSAESRVRAHVDPQGEPSGPGHTGLFRTAIRSRLRHASVHADSTSAARAQAANAAAYAVSNHIIFGLGRYSPHTRSGRQLGT